MWSICGWCCMVEIYGKYCMTVCGKYVYIYNYMGNVYGMSWIYADYVSKWLLGGCFWKYEHHWWICSCVHILRVIHVPISWNMEHQQTTNLPIIQTNLFDSFTFFILLRKRNIFAGYHHPTYGCKINKYTFESQFQIIISPPKILRINDPIIIK